MIKQYFVTQNLFREIIGAQFTYILSVLHSI